MVTTDHRDTTPAESCPAGAAIRSPRILAELAARAGRDEDAGAVAERELARWFRALREERALLALAPRELVVVIEGWLLAELAHARPDRPPFASLADAVEAACERGAAQRNEVDGPDLVARLRALPPARTLALVDAIERLDADPTLSRTAQMDLARELGILKADPAPAGGDRPAGTPEPTPRVFAGGRLLGAAGGARTVPPGRTAGRSGAG
jgi:hypothetical protein